LDFLEIFKNYQILNFKAICAEGAEWLLAEKQA
jgi:hypothetical protein